MNMYKVTVIIPNYNGAHFLAPCLDALQRQSMMDFGIIVVDNGSEDKSLELLARDYPYAKVIEMGENTGFCRAVNAAVPEANSEYIILLNNDTVPDASFVEALVNAMEARANAFSCSSCMLKLDEPNIIDGAGDLYNALGWAIARGKGQPAEKFNKAVRVFSACAGAAIYRREPFIDLGMFDESHFAYLEDLDIGYRARIRGWENWYTPEAKVLHVGSGTSGSRYNEFKVKNSARNNVYIIYKNMPKVQRIINAPLHLIGFGIKSVYFKKKGYAKLYKSSLKEGRNLAKSKEGRANVVAFSRRYLKNYVKIQLELWANIFRRYG